MHRLALLMLPLILAACSEVVAEREGTFRFEGEDYRAVTRTLEVNGRTFDRRVVYYDFNAISCSATDDVDCEAAMRAGPLNRNTWDR